MMEFIGEHIPRVSIIIPVRNGSQTLDFCLRSVKRSYYKDIEVIVVDDHSTDGSASIARRYTSKVLGVTDGEGANHARNVGAHHAQGQILVFIDSDIVIARETILGIVETLEEEGPDAVVGIYTAKHRHETFVSQYKNLWVRYSYLKSPPTIDWLFGAISGIKRGAFEKIGGFNIELLSRHGHDDIELGKRFANAHLKIVLNMDIEVEHVKNYSFCSFVKNEFHRSVGFAQLATQLGETPRSLVRGFVNVYPAFVVSTLASIVILAILVAGAAGWISSWFVMAVCCLYLMVNIRFLNYLEQVRGLFAMIVMIPLLFIDHIACFVGSLVGIARGLLKKGPASLPS